MVIRYDKDSLTPLYIMDSDLSEVVLSREDMRELMRFVMELPIECWRGIPISDLPYDQMISAMDWERDTSEEWNEASPISS